MPDPIADTQDPDQNGGVGASAAGAQEQEISIPKWRLDQLAKENREIKEQLRMTNQILAAQAQARQQPQNPEPNLDQLGLDPQVAQAVDALVQHRVKALVEPQARKFQSQAAAAFGKAEEAEFLMTHAKGDPKRMSWLKSQMPRIKAYQQEAHQQGVPLSLDFAWRFIQVQDQENRPAQPRGQSPAQAQQPGVQQPATRVAQPAAPAPAQTFDAGADDDGFPSPDGTRINPAPSGQTGTGASKAFDDLSFEEMEAQLKEQGFDKGFIA